MLCNDCSWSIKIVRFLYDVFHFFPDSLALILYYQGERMRLVSLFFILILTAACGKDNDEKSVSSQKSGLCSLNGQTVACQSIVGADGLGIDLLESMIDVPVKVQDTDVTFLADKTAISTGRRITCKTSVKNGEIYRIALRGDKLLVMTGDGSLEMERLNEGTGLNGTWVWKGYVDEGTHIFRQMTFLSTNRVILRNNCEL